LRRILKWKEEEENSPQSKMKRRKTLTQSKSVVNKDSMSQIMKFVITVSGDALQLILNDTYLRAHFAFIVHFSKSVIAYSVTPHQKGGLVTLVQNKLDSQNRVMAVGDGLNDGLMLQAADVGIEIAKKIEQPIANAGDIIIEDLASLKKLVVYHGKTSFNNFLKMTYYCFYKSFLLGLPLFLFDWYSSSTGTPLVESMLVFMFTFVFTLIPAVAFGAYDTPYISEVLMRFPALYPSVVIKNPKSTFVTACLVDAVLEACLIFYTSISVVDSGLSKDGYVGDYSILMIVVFISILGASFLKVSL
jgi:magnesium-transporting ATPase (P-type)